MSDTNQNDPNWERQTLEKLAFAAIREQRRNRFWGVLFKSLTFIYLFMLLFYALDWVGGDSSANSDHTAIIDIYGVIGSDDQVSADDVIGSLESAYENKHTKGIILRINSPGGSPVQAGIINDEIHRQRKLHPNIPVYAVVEDICASGGYYIAVAADKIFVDKASIVGSIGVLMDGFGFTGIMDKVGVERRLLTAGENKAILDPFSPVNPKHKEYAQSMLNQIHQQFIAVVREGRGKRLKETDDTFSGLFWSGETSVQMGLADGFGSSDYVAREIIKQEKIVDFTAREGLADKFAKRIGASMGNAAMGTVFNGMKMH
ncbi:MULTISPECIES: S49 family peptidase [Methylovorus]|jgi:protease-4|uniref:Peptidase S49 n=1 Tax=Methylovorus glucosotrophus (strain SIP3-4) TaxID=582744 RepID=C6XD89_METGS|nr:MULTISPECIES: S49 family peptidase [Methylovorus]ACT50514.1 peptidase S49 [Methylovorus glucosotrophus SIP3-4]ADQ84504.1 peptidase S49 [Methylovorus sp. MP688]KAF0844081.1 protease-4 [Methylovorus glucosotrophus]